MDQMLQALQDPVWWLTAVFLTILGSVAAAYLNDALSWGFAGLSSRYRAAKAIRDRRLLRRIDQLAQNEALLVIEWIHAVGLQVLFTASLTMYAIVGVVLLQSSTTARVELRVLPVLIGALAAWAGYVATSRTLLVRRARRAYRRRIRAAMGPEIASSDAPNA